VTSPEHSNVRPAAATDAALPGAATVAQPPVAGGLATMHPAYFGMVMATGIVSLAANSLVDQWGVALRWIAQGLFYANIAVYFVLWGLLILRLVRHRDRVQADLMHHGRSVGFFTLVAATCVLGSQVLLIGGNSTIAWALWLAGLVLWAAVTYSVFTILTVKSIKPTLAEGINGGWLLAVVAAQSVSVLGSQLAAGGGPSPEMQRPLLFVCLAMWLGGGMLYIWIISLIFYRYTFFSLSPSDLAPPYWINMGAVAISTLAGTMLIANATEGRSPVLAELLPFVKGLTVGFWATATWWIPMLVILGIWRHIYRRFPLRYDPLYWGAVFPLGMYTVCTIRLSQSIEAPFLMVIPRWFVWLALGAWLLAFAGLAFTLLRQSRNHG
jgi:tellurite resistance protein TehA-like permease